MTDQTSTKTTDTTDEVTQVTDVTPVAEAPAPSDGGTGQETEATEEQPTEEEPKTFDLEYVQKLRRENANYRERAGKADELGARLHKALVQGTGRLQDPTDLPFDLSHLADDDALTGAIDALLAAKPHLASRRPQGTIPQGATPEPSAGVTLGGMLRQSAG